MEITEAAIYSNLNSYRKMLNGNDSGQENNTAYSLMDSGFQTSYLPIKKEKDYPVKPGKYKNYFFAHLARHIFKKDLHYILKMEDRNLLDRFPRSKFVPADNSMYGPILTTGTAIGLFEN